MAKKVVATLSKGDTKKLVKLIQAKKSEKTGAYTFRSKIIAPELMKELLSKEI
ncbi:DUF4295 domain-containing protein [Cardinium endosymbiont of Culicoides punctatus]|uniref:DUF4295 domain-containing protein n=1 Tax=Cardinium endosymbiont of Culicoides punctatus TaxID=2304601 RepID=UPI001058ACDA|nr:DUF4295 domain-containing protein [Cardinium endosymbiont of Culicoides punctatus]TDG95492.1 hypothetical protein CCPUN_03130 [Cardinium endosymbiont of Culicoides punctatus]